MKSFESRSTIFLSEFRVWKYVFPVPGKAKIIFVFILSIIVNKVSDRHAQPIWLCLKLCYSNVMNAEIVGFIAGILVASSLLPQVIKSWKTKSTSDISLGWSVTSLAGQIMWIFYGVLIASYSLVIMSSITLVMALSVFYLKLKYGMKR